MKHTKIQKTVAAILIPFFFFGFTFRFPFLDFFGGAEAGTAKVYSLVSILVNEEVYSGVKSSVNRYANDIQKQLENTRVVIIPTPKNATAFQIASLNESLYYEGYAGVKEGANFNSQLVGSVFVGNTPAPVVYDGSKTARTILPYTDFTDKKYVYNHTNGRYEKNENNLEGARAEIWHGLIVPNTGTVGGDIDAINGFFDKDHDFYVGEGNFQKEKGVINGKPGEELKEGYKPYVFYFDQFREQAGLSYAKYKGYEAYLENKEDLNYSRYSKELAEKIQDKVLGAEREQIKDLIADLDSTIDVDALSGGPDVGQTSAISTRYITKNVSKKFLEVINSSTLGNFRKNVYNAGRYNGTGSQVNVDTIPYLISILDAVGDEVVKGVNNNLENKIDEFVSGGFSRDIALPTFLTIAQTQKEINTDALFGSDDGSAVNETKHVTTTNENILFGQTASDITDAYQCSFYRGSHTNSGTLVEANRGYNIKHIQADIAQCGRADTQGYWGGSSPVNLDMGKISGAELILKAHDSTKAIVPLYDISGGKKEENTTYTPSPLNCSIPNYISIKKTTLQQDNGDDGGFYGFGNLQNDDFTLPLHGESALNWTCNTENQTYGYIKSFEETYKGFSEEAKGSIEAKGNVLLDFSAPIVGGGALGGLGGSVPVVRAMSFSGSGSVSIRGTGKVRYNFTSTGTIAINGADAATINGGGETNIIEGITNTFDFTGAGSFDFMGILSPAPIGLGLGNLVTEGQSCNYRALLLEDVLVGGFQGLDGIDMSGGFGGGEGGEDEQTGCIPDRLTFKYKKIPSILTHKAPTPEHLSSQIKGVVSPALPIDINRYVDFISAAGNHVKIEYPYLYRLQASTEEDTDFDQNFENIVTSLDDFLDAKSEEINQKIRENDPSLLEGRDAEIYDLLKHGEYPEDNFDLKSYLQTKPVKSFMIDGDEKNISYYDTLAFAIFWNNLNSVSQKYKFIFEHYLSDQFEGDVDFALPKHKKVYEIAYLGAPGNAQNMYVTLDPENKGENPYADVVSNNLESNAHILAANVFDSDQQSENEEGTFTCAPPEGVPLWEWIPAVMCWLEDMLPPKIEFGKSKCAAETIFGENEQDVYDFGQESVSLAAQAACQKDDNKNGLSDCLENEISNGILVLDSSTSRSAHEKTIVLESEIQNEGGGVISGVNNMKTIYELVKIEAAQDEEKGLDNGASQVIYDVEKANESTSSQIKKYISIGHVASPVVSGKSQYIFRAKNKDANIYFKSKVVLLDHKGEIVKELSSEVIKTEIRGSTFALDSYALDERGELGENLGVVASEYKNIFLVDTSKNSLESVKTGIANASLSEGTLVFGVSNNLVGGSVEYPLTVSFEKDGEQILEDFIVSEAELVSFKSLLSMQESGEYELAVTDGFGETIRKSFSVLPGLASDVNIALGANALEAGGNITTNLITISDTYGNIVRGTPLDVSLKIVGGGVKFSSADNGLGKTKKTTLYDGYKAFRLQPTEEVGNNVLSVVVQSEGKTLVSKTEQIHTLEKIVPEVIMPEEALTVGGKDYTFDIELKDSSGGVLSDFDSRVYVSVNSIYGSIENDYTTIENGNAQVVFKSSNVAGENIPIELKVEGLATTIRKNITVLPEKPMKIDLVLTKSKMEASNQESSLLNVELKDRYNNLVTTDSSTQFEVELKDEYAELLSIDNPVKTSNNGKASFSLDGTGIPGTSYVKVKTTPDIGENFYKIGTGTGTKIVHGEGENATKLQTHFFWNKEHIDGNNYNALYSVLLGAEYGDFTQDDYLAGSLLFDSDNRSLAVTSLLNNPHSFSDSITLGKNAGMDIVASRGDLSQSIDMKVNFDDQNRLGIDAFNKGLNTYIGRIYYNFPSDTALRTCVGEGDDFSDCNIAFEKTSITLKALSSQHEISSLGEELHLAEKEGNTLLKIDKTGKFTLNPLVNLEIDTNANASQDYMVLNIKSTGSVIGKVAINFSNHEYLVTRNSETLDAKLAATENILLLHLSSYMYGTRDVATDGGTAKAIYYNDPFSDEEALDRFSGDSLFGLENFTKEAGLGWKGENKFLLSFAAGKSVGESVKDYASFGTVTLGDPVIHLKKIQKIFNNSTDKKSFDSGVGKLLTSDDDIEAYKVFDYDNDDKTDILLIKSDGYLKLLENKAASTYFLDKGNLAYLADYGNASYVQAGDFTGDGFDDIFFVNNKGEPFLLNNNNKDFIRIPLEEQLGLKGKPVQVQGFDMDADGIFDLVMLDDAGDINIFYGGGTEVGPRFTKKTIESGYGITLNSEVRNDGGLVYFDGLVQLQEEEYSSAVIGGANTESSDEINESLVDSMVFARVHYSTGIINETQINSGVLNALPVLDSDDLGSSSAEASNAVQGFLSSFSGSVELNGNNYSATTTFMRSEYSATAGVQVAKVFTDRNGGNLQTGDLVDVTVTLKNISAEEKKSIAYVDTVSSPFEMTQNKINLSSGLERVAPAGYQLLVDEIDLAPGASMTISYELKVLPIKFGFIQAGLFEKDEAGDDMYGDIIIKPDNKNCSQTVDIFRSVSSRGYDTKKQAPPKCDDSKLALPDELEKNKLDVDGNGVPDYIDEIIADQDKQREFGKNTLNELHEDTDGDGIPDREDSSPDFNNEDGDDNFLEVLEGFNQSVDDISASMDTMIEGFGCGFGGGSCISTPLNWAPLAAGQDPTLFGYPIGDGLRVGEGVPIFSAFTGINVPTTSGCYQIPAAWPASPFQFTGSCNTNIQAGGALGTSSPTNFVRLFATPTLTGGFGVSACFGGPASVVGNSIPAGVSPIVPGGNCIVYAAPLASCSNDGSEGDPESLGLAEEFGGGESGFGVVNANCGVEQGGKKGGYATDKYLNVNFLEDYYDYKETGAYSTTLSSNYKEALGTLSSSTNSGAGGYNPNKPLIGVNSGGVNGQYEFGVSLDFDGDTEGNFSDVLQIQKKRVGTFPSFLMDWATRQIEEVVTKLTDFPTLFVILPDFGGLFDTDWGDYIGKELPEAMEKGKQKEQNRKGELDQKRDTILASKSGLDCIGKDEIKCLSIDVQAGKITAQKNKPGQETISGIRAVYDFLGNIPLVSVKPQQINVEIPWVDSTTLNRTLLNWKLTKQQWENEGAGFGVGSGAGVSATASVDYGKLVSSLDKNIQILESYKEIPTKLSKLFNQKEVWLGQILCNVEAISALTGEWIGFNGKRFKAWVELYILIKAILKSWQLLVDVFNDYDAECHECKNERNDLLNFEFKLIDMIIPKIPVIKFPKWPDVILDLHNIRAGLIILMPDFNVTQRPIVLPNLPELHLPDLNANLALNGSITLPEIPLLPELEIPELPDLPGLPTVTLPNLPPPPTLPEIFSSLKGILKILKLVAKAMCILKSSPFVPEWRSGDQIAFLTERMGYLPTDFLDLTLPEFSLPFVDAIKVTTWVNLEFEVEFLAELMKQIVEPINSSSSNIVNKFSNAGLDSLDFRGHSKNIDIQENKAVDLGVRVNGIEAGTFAKVLSLGVMKVFNHIETHKDSEVNSRDFLALVNKSLADIEVTSDPRLEKVLTLWDSVNKQTYYKEEQLIKNLQKNNAEKFNALTTIIEKEIQKTKQLQKDIEILVNPEKSLFRKIAAEKSSKDFVEYNKTLKDYNKKFLVSAKQLISGEIDNEVVDIKKQGDKLLARVQGGLSNYQEGLKAYSSSGIDMYSQDYAQLAAVTNNATESHAGNSCQQSNSSTYSYNYKGLYIIEKEKSYRLFDYTDELFGDEGYKDIDFDNDGDTDLLYFVNGELFLKENLTTVADKETVSLPALVVGIEENKFFNGEDFIEAVNGLKEINTDNRSINIVFNAPTNENITHFRFEYYTTIDKFVNKNNSGYIPTGVSKNVIDAFVSVDERTVESTSEIFTKRKHQASIDYVGAVPGVRLSTFEMINIKDDIKENKEVTISQGTQVYTGNQSANIKYYIGNDEEDVNNILIEEGHSLEFQETITIIKITGNVYVKSENIVTLAGSDEISTYAGLPFFPETKIDVIPDFKERFNESSHINISYPDSPDTSLNFSEIDSYEIYDLGHESSDYLIKLDRPNDYLYGKIRAFSENILGTLSQQILSSPQVEADQYAPELSFNGTLRVPVYQKKTFDLSSFIYDNSGFEAIADISIDFNLDLDSDGDGDPSSDADTQGMTITHTPSKIMVEFGEFDTLMQKKIGVTLTDENGNVGYKEIDFEVYAPVPEITTNDDVQVEGALDEQLVGEPINLYRLRGGKITQLENISGKIKVDTLEEGAYNFSVTQGGLKGLELTSSGITIAKVDESTGKITVLDVSAQVKVISDDTGYPKIVIEDAAGSQKYFEYIKLLDNRDITIVDSFDTIDAEGMYVKFFDTAKFSHYTIPTGTSYNPGAVVIYKAGDASKAPVFTLFPDGRILGVNELYQLKYVSIGDYVGFELIARQGNVKLAEIMMRVDAGYLMK